MNEIVNHSDVVGASPVRCSWSVACWRCSNYIIIPNLTHGFNELGKDNFKARGETFMFWDLVHLVLEVWQYITILPATNVFLVSICNTTFIPKLLPLTVHGLYLIFIVIIDVLHVMLAILSQIPFGDLPAWMNIKAFMVESKDEHEISWHGNIICKNKHYHVMTWNHLHYWSFVRGIHWSPVDSSHKGAVVQTLMVSLFLSPPNIIWRGHHEWWASICLSVYGFWSLYWKVIAQFISDLVYSYTC